MQDFSGETIWIIGASSGIGQALARLLAARGAQLILSARRAEALDSLRAELGEQHVVKAMDVANIEHIPLVTEEIERSIGQVDRVIFLAALYKPSAIELLDMSEVRDLLAVNLLGAIALSQAAIKLLKKNKGRRGQLALCASVAGFVGLPHGQPYSASKAALINFAESLHAEVGDWVDIKLINPGFVRTPLTAQNKFHMPMALEPEEAATYIASGLQKKSFEIHFPKVFTCLLKALAALPYALKLPLLRRMSP